MAKKSAPQPKLRKRTAIKPDRTGLAPPASLPAVLRAFRAATGWPLEYVVDAKSGNHSGLSWSAPETPGVGASLGHLRLGSVKDDAPPHENGIGLVDRAAARKLASAIEGLLSELMETRRALWQREADLAAGIPLPLETPEPRHLAERMEAVLQGGAEAVGCQAIALYLLDEATTELKMRACWGLPLDRLIGPARPLQGAIADLEAMLGHAVVLEDAENMPQWNAPEDFASAVCVPVSTSTNLLGTLWVFCNQKRDFTPRQTNLLEIVAGRLAADLEREVLLREGVDAAAMKRELAEAERLQRSQLPKLSPLLDGWQLAGWAGQAQDQGVGGAFYDWFSQPRGTFAAVVGDSCSRGVEGALAAAALRAAVRAHGQYHRQSRQTLQHANLTLWTGSAGDQRASLFYSTIETATGHVCFSLAGQPSVLLVRREGWKPLGQEHAFLGESPEADFPRLDHCLQPGEALVIFSSGVREALDPDDIPLSEPGVAEIVMPRLSLKADEIVAAIRQQMGGPSTRHGGDRAILVIKRTVP